MTDNFLLGLSVKLKDLYSGKLKEIDAKTRDFEKDTKHLQKTISDIKAYRSAEAELAKFSGTNTKALQKIQRLGKGLKDAGIDTKNLTREMDKLNEQMADTNGHMDKMSKFKAIGAGASVGLSAGGAIAGIAIGASAFNEAASQTAAAIGLTSKSAGDLRSTFLDIYRITGKSADEISEAYRRTTQQLNLTGDAAKQATVSFLNIQRIHPEMDTSEIIRASAQMKKAWGTSAQDSMDLIAKAMALAGDNADDLLDTFWEYAPTMKEAGLSAEQFTAMLVAGAKKGAYNYDKMADSIKESIKGRITDAGIWDNLVGKGKKKGIVDELLGQENASKIKAQLATLRQGIIEGDDKLKSTSYANLLTGLSTIYAKDATKGRNIIEQVFGSMGADDLTNDVIAAMGQGIADPSKILGNVSGTLNDQLNTRKTLMTEMGAAWRTVSSEFMKSTGDMAESLAPIGTMIKNIATGVAGFMKAHPMITKIALGLTAVAAAAGTIVAVIGVAGAAYGVLATGLATATPLFSAIAAGLVILKGAVIGLSSSLLTLVANPVGATIMGVAALAFGVYQLYKHFDVVKEKLSALWGGLKSFASGVSKITSFWPFSRSKDKNEDASKKETEDDQIFKKDSITKAIMSPASVSVSESLAQVAKKGDVSAASIAAPVMPVLPVPLRPSAIDTLHKTTAPTNAPPVMPVLPHAKTNSMGGGMIQISFSPTINIQTETGNSEDIEAGILKVFQDPSTGILWEMERMLNKVMDNNAYKMGSHLNY